LPVPVRVTGRAGLVRSASYSGK